MPCQPFADWWHSWRYASVDGSNSATRCVCVSAVLWDYLVPSWCVIKEQCGTPDSDQSSGSNTHCGTTTEKCLMYHCSICCTIHCWFNRPGSERCSLLHGIFHYQQCSYSLAFFFFSHWNHGFIKGDSLLRRIFSNVFFSQPFPKPLSGKRHS